jgi:hypothetical protein
MSQSRFVRKDFGGININNFNFTTESAGSLLIDNVSVGGSSNNLGSLIVTSDPDIINNYITNPSTIGLTSGSLISTTSGDSGIYIGDDVIALYNNDNKDIIIEGSTIHFGNAQSSYALINISNDTLNTYNLTYYNKRIQNFQTTTQTGTISTDINISEQNGIIRLVSSTLAALNSVSFTVNYNGLTTSDGIILSISKYTGTGIPYVFVSDKSADEFIVTLHNIHPTVALNDVIDITYSILQEVLD